MEKKLKWSGGGKLIHKNFGLEQEVSWEADFNLEEINRGDILKVKVKMPGAAIANPHTLPYENYLISGQFKQETEDNNLAVNIENAILKEWKEVYLYSYGMKFITNTLSLGTKEIIDRLEFFIPNLLIGYDEMSFGEEIINYSEFNIELNNESISKNYKFKITGNPKFNDIDSFSNLDAQTNFTAKLTVNCESQELDYDEVTNIVDDFLRLIGFAYGGLRPWVMIKGFYKGTFVWQHIRDINYPDSSNPLPAIPVGFSKELSNFIKDVLPKFYYLNPIDKSEFLKLFTNLSKASTKTDFIYIFRNLDQSLKFFSINHTSYQESDKESVNQYDANFKTIFKDISYAEFRLNSFLKRAKEIYKTGYKEGDYKLLLQTITIIHKFVFKYFDYQGKYWDWSNISPVINENEF